MKTAGALHYGGINITRGFARDNVEKCKFWCLITPYCKGVDFNSQTNTCYYHRELQASLMSTNPDVTHYVKTECTSRCQFLVHMPQR